MGADKILPYTPPHVKPPGILICIFLVGGLEHFFIFSYTGNNHPN